MKSSAPLAIFKAGTNALAYVSALFLAVAVVLPVYLYPAYFLASVINYAPFILIFIFIVGYNIVQYRNRATVEIYDDKLTIRTVNKRYNVYYNDIQNISKEQKYGKNLFIMETKAGRKIALYDRKLFTFKMTLLQFIMGRTKSVQPQES